LHKCPIEAVQPRFWQYLVLVAQLKNRKNLYLVVCKNEKIFTPQLFYELSLDRLVPTDNFYRRVNQELNLHFLYKSTKNYYGTQGQESIDPVVFFKILLVAYLNNINSDRALIRYCSNCLDVRLFLGDDLNEELL
jgi:transposase